VLFERMWRAARLDPRLYEELRRDPVAVSQAIAVILIAILATVAGAALASLFQTGSRMGDPCAPLVSESQHYAECWRSVQLANLPLPLEGGSVLGHVVGGLAFFMPGMWLLPAASLWVLGGLARATNPQRGSSRDLFIAAGFSASPGVFFLLLSFPEPIARIVAPLVTVWVLAAMVGAARATLGVSLFRALLFIGPGILLFLLLTTRGA